MVSLQRAEGEAPPKENTVVDEEAQQSRLGGGGCEKLPFTVPSRLDNAPLGYIYKCIHRSNRIRC